VTREESGPDGRSRPGQGSTFVPLSASRSALLRPSEGNDVGLHDRHHTRRRHGWWCRLAEGGQAASNGLHHRTEPLGVYGHVPSGHVAAGQGVAITWRSLRQLVLYSALISMGLRFFDYALAGGELWSIGGFFLGWVVQFAIAAFAYRLTRARQMVRQYPWLYERKGLLGWEERH